MIKGKIKHYLDTPIAFRPKVFIGFDGYIDTVMKLMTDSRGNMTSMTSFGQLLMHRENQNTSLSFNRQFRRIGGNMPITANALGTLDVQVSCVGALGNVLENNLFSDMHKNCIKYSVAAPGECIAIEFSDSKLFLADHGSVEKMTWDDICQKTGKEKLIEMLTDATVIAMVNWGELENMHAIWADLYEMVKKLPKNENRLFFFDLADSSGRSDTALLSVISLMKKYGEIGKTVLSVNNNELVSLSDVVQKEKMVHDGHTESTLSETKRGELLVSSDGVDILVHHGKHYARVFTKENTEEAIGQVIQQPRILTGGGDHFNAGFILGMLLECSLMACAEIGNIVSSIYVERGESPNLFDIVSACP